MAPRHQQTVRPVVPICRARLGFPAKNPVQIVAWGHDAHASVSGRRPFDRAKPTNSPGGNLVRSSLAD
jgi:hypothetical protein